MEWEAREADRVSKHGKECDGAEGMLKVSENRSPDPPGKDTLKSVLNLGTRVPRTGNWLPRL